MHLLSPNTGSAKRQAARGGDSPRTREQPSKPPLYDYLTGLKELAFITTADRVKMATAVGEIKVVRQGILYKRGEFIRTWRPRFFQLKTDGSLRGWVLGTDVFALRLSYSRSYSKTTPPGPGDMPLNFFELTRQSAKEFLSCLLSCSTDFMAGLLLFTADCAAGGQAR
jgi:hypothetical protein